METKHYDFSKRIFKIAWGDTCAFFGWNLRTLVVSGLMAAGFGVYWYSQGWAAVKQEFLVTALIVLGPMGLFAFGLMLWNLFIAPFKLVYERVGMTNTPTATQKAPQKRKATQQGRFKFMADTVSWLRGEIEEARQWVGLRVASDLPPKIDSVYIDLRKLGLETPSIPKATERDLYYRLHLEYINNIHPYLQAGQAKEAKDFAKRASKEINEGLKKGTSGS